MEEAPRPRASPAVLGWILDHAVACDMEAVAEAAARSLARRAGDAEEGAEADAAAGPRAVWAWLRGAVARGDVRAGRAGSALVDALADAFAPELAASNRARRMLHRLSAEMRRLVVLRPLRGEAAGPNEMSAAREALGAEFRRGAGEPSAAAAVRRELSAVLGEGEARALGYARLHDGTRAEACARELLQALRAAWWPESALAAAAAAGPAAEDEVRAGSAGIHARARRPPLSSGVRPAAKRQRREHPAALAAPPAAAAAAAAGAWRPRRKGSGDGDGDGTVALADSDDAAVPSAAAAPATAVLAPDLWRAFQSEIMRGGESGKEQRRQWLSIVRGEHAKVAAFLKRRDGDGGGGGGGGGSK